MTDSAAYVYDALDRIVIKSEYHSGSWTTICTVYEGDSTTVASEKVYPYASPTGNPSDLKTYAYDGSGNIVSLTDQSGGNANRYSLVANPQNSVSLLLDASGNVKQSYGYSAYGQANGTLTQLGTLSSTLDPYRFQEKRLDPAFNSYDMGARRYSLTTDRWQQQDMYYDASQDLGLAGDPTTSDKYEFLGGNPVNYVEADGHFTSAGSGGGMRCGTCKAGGRIWGPRYRYGVYQSWASQNADDRATIWRKVTWCSKAGLITGILELDEWVEFGHNMRWYQPTTEDKDTYSDYKNVRNGIDRLSSLGHRKLTIIAVDSFYDRTWGKIRGVARFNTTLFADGRISVASSYVDAACANAASDSDVGDEGMWPSPPPPLM